MMPLSEFEFFGFAHVVAMGVILVVPIVLTLVVKWIDSERATQVICYAFAGVVALNEVLNWSYRIATVGIHEFVREYMPLHVCGITVFAVVVMLIFRRQTAYEIAYFWGLVGATNAVVTPQLEFGYPQYRFFQYFIAHGGIVAADAPRASTRVLGDLGVIAGGMLVQESLNAGQEAEIHAAALEELNISFSDAASDSVLEMEDTTITLTGTVEEQYLQLRDILKEIWLQEAGAE